MCRAVPAQQSGDGADLFGNGKIAFLLQIYYKFYKCIIQLFLTMEA